MTCYILGENSFVGKTLFEYMKDKTHCYLVARKTIDLLNPATFSNIDFSNSVIIDCINVNNGNKEEIVRTNVSGFTNLINYLKQKAVNLKYVYMSTISVTDETAVKGSAYVNSKKTAEDTLMASGLDYQIMRLSYPIGKGENKSRLFPRLISQLKNNEPVTVNDILINPNAVEDVVKDIYHQLQGPKITFISSNNYFSLAGLVLFLKENLRSESSITVNEAKEQYLPKSETPFEESQTIKQRLLQMI
ncbi:MAG: NAD-dependent epimerase/dehydratase family protein [Bacteroidia bacterium]|nr:NAD-dependent epimerase/dehydratase family protein [Bacteroidia bacterium]